MIGKLDDIIKKLFIKEKDYCRFCNYYQTYFDAVGGGDIHCIYLFRNKKEVRLEEYVAFHNNHFHLKEKTACPYHSKKTSQVSK